MNAALCFATQSHGSRQLGAEAAAEADLHLPVPPVWTLPLLRGDRPHDSFCFPVWRGEALLFSLAPVTQLSQVSATVCFSHQTALKKIHFLKHLHPQQLCVLCRSWVGTNY